MLRLETARLKLRDFVASDAAFIHSVIGSRVGVPDFPRTYSIEEAAAWVEKSAVRQERDSAAFWLAKRISDGRPVGFYGPVVQTIESERFHEVGWYTHQDFRRQGYAREAAIACLDWAFDHFQVARIGALILPNNQPSIAVAKSLGMSPGRIVEHASLPHVAYSVDKETVRSLLRGCESGVKER